MASRTRGPVGRRSTAASPTETKSTAAIQSARSGPREIAITTVSRSQAVRSISGRRSGGRESQAKKGGLAAATQIALIRRRVREIVGRTTSGRLIEQESAAKRSCCISASRMASQTRSLAVGL